MAPDMIDAFNRIATVRGHKAIQKVVFPFEGQIKTASGERAGHRLDAGIGLVYGFVLASLDAIGDHVKSSDDLIWHETAKVAYDLLAHLAQFFSPTAPLRIELL